MTVLAAPALGQAPAPKAEELFAAARPHLEAVLGGRLGRLPTFRTVKPADLAARMLQVLESQRPLGGDAYPTTLRRLAELCDRKASDSIVPKAATHANLADRVVSGINAVLTRAGRPTPSDLAAGYHARRDPMLWELLAVIEERFGRQREAEAAGGRLPCLTAPPRSCSSAEMSRSTDRHDSCRPGSP